MKIFIACLALCFLVAGACAQGSRGQYWLRYQNQIYLSSSLYWANEIDNRRFMNPDQQGQFIVHSRLHRAHGRWDYAAGLTLSYAFAPGEKPSDRSVVSELRPVAEASYSSPLGKITLLNRVRLDNRFFESEPDRFVWEQPAYRLRARYRIQIRIPMRYGLKEQSANLRFANELMLHDERRHFDQNRFYATIDWPIAKGLALETGYIHVYQQRATTGEKFVRHVLRASVLHRIRRKSRA